MADDQLPAVATTTQVFIQKGGVLVAKALLSSVPLASLAFDFGQLCIDLANEKVASKFLHELAERVDRLDDEVKQRIRANPDHEIAAHSALRALTTETNERVAVALARAVASLATMPVGSVYKAQCARVLEELNEPILHALQTNERYHSSRLSETERSLFLGHMEAIERMNLLLEGTLSIPHWDSVMRRLMQLGLIEVREDQGRFEEATNVVQTAPTTKYGLMILSLCFEDPSVPAFGRFARQ